MKKFIEFLLDIFAISCTIAILLIISGILLAMLITPIWYFIALGSYWYLAAYLPLILAIVLAIYDKMR